MHTHQEKASKHDQRTKRCQAEAGSIRLSAQSPRQVGVPHTWVCGQQASTPKTSPLPNVGAYTQRELFEQSSTFFNQLNLVLEKLSDERVHNEG